MKLKTKDTSNWIGKLFNPRKLTTKVHGNVLSVSRFDALSKLLSMCGQSHPGSTDIIESFAESLKSKTDLNAEEVRWLGRLRELIELKNLLYPTAPHPQSWIREGFAFSQQPRALASHHLENSMPLEFPVLPVAVRVANLHWRVLETARGGFGPLSTAAQKILEDVVGGPFHPVQTQEKVLQLTDAMQKSEGIPFLVLNLVKQKSFAAARKISQFVLLDAPDVAEVLRSSVYWIAELSYFLNHSEKKQWDHDETIQHLYHLCFMFPDQASFLEIDSRFFGQFELLNETAREGFVFKTALIENLLQAWADSGPLFDDVFGSLLMKMMELEAAPAGGHETWNTVWQRKKERFNQDALSVVEGNLHYAGKDYVGAARLYAQALAINPGQRSALFNSLFAYAQLGDRARHAAIIEHITSCAHLLPSGLSAIGNSFELMGDYASAAYYHRLLEQTPDWARQVDYYRSVFCYEQELFDRAVEFGSKAVELNPSDQSMKLNLSSCLAALNRKPEALALISRMESIPDWVKFFRFTLERDTGQAEAAAATLLQLAPDYFDDSSELEQARRFARQTRDLVLLRHLKPRH